MKSSIWQLVGQLYCCLYRSPKKITEKEILDESEFTCLLAEVNEGLANAYRKCSREQKDIARALLGQLDPFNLAAYATENNINTSLPIVESLGLPKETFSKICEKYDPETVERHLRYLYSLDGYNKALLEGKINRIHESVLLTSALCPVILQEKEEVFTKPDKLAEPMKKFINFVGGLAGIALSSEETKEVGNSVAKLKTLLRRKAESDVQGTEIALKKTEQDAEVKIIQKRSEIKRLEQEINSLGDSVKLQKEELRQALEKKLSEYEQEFKGQIKVKEFIEKHGDLFALHGNFYAYVGDIFNGVTSALLIMMTTDLGKFLDPDFTAPLADIAVDETAKQYKSDISRLFEKNVIRKATVYSVFILKVVTIDLKRSPHPLFNKTFDEFERITTEDIEFLNNGLGKQLGEILSTGGYGLSAVATLTDEINDYFLQKSKTAVVFPYDQKEVLGELKSGRPVLPEAYLVAECTFNRDNIVYFAVKDSKNIKDVRIYVKKAVQYALSRLIISSKQATASYIVKLTQAVNGTISAYVSRSFYGKGVNHFVPGAAGTPDLPMNFSFIQADMGTDYPVKFVGEHIGKGHIDKAFTMASKAALRESVNSSTSTLLIEKSFEELKQEIEREWEKMQRGPQIGFWGRAVNWLYNLLSTKEATRYMLRHSIEDDMLRDVYFSREGSDIIEARGGFTVKKVSMESYTTYKAFATFPAQKAIELILGALPPELQELELPVHKKPVDLTQLQKTNEEKKINYGWRVEVLFFSQRKRMWCIRYVHASQTKGGKSVQIADYFLIPMEEMWHIAGFKPEDLRTSMLEKLPILFGVSESVIQEFLLTEQEETEEERKRREEEEQKKKEEEEAAAEKEKEDQQAEPQQQTQTPAKEEPAQEEPVPEKSKEETPAEEPPEETEEEGVPVTTEDKPTDYVPPTDRKEQGEMGGTDVVQFPDGQEVSKEDLKPVIAKTLQAMADQVAQSVKKPNTEEPASSGKSPQMADKEEEKPPLPPNEQPDEEPPLPEKQQESVRRELQRLYGLKKEAILGESIETPPVSVLRSVMHQESIIPTIEYMRNRGYSAIELSLLNEQRFVHLLANDLVTSAIEEAIHQLRSDYIPEEIGIAIAKLQRRPAHSKFLLTESDLSDIDVLVAEEVDIPDEPYDVSPDEITTAAEAMSSANEISIGDNVANYNASSPEIVIDSDMREYMIAGDMEAAIAKGQELYPDKTADEIAAALETYRNAETSMSPEEVELYLDADETPDEVYPEVPVPEPSPAVVDVNYDVPEEEMDAYSEAILLRKDGKICEVSIAGQVKHMATKRLRLLPSNTDLNSCLSQIERGESIQEVALKRLFSRVQSVPVKQLKENDLSSRDFLVFYANTKDTSSLVEVYGGYVDESNTAVIPLKSLSQEQIQSLHERLVESELHYCTARSRLHLDNRLSLIEQLEVPEGSESEVAATAFVDSMELLKSANKSLVDVEGYMGKIIALLSVDDKKGKRTIKSLEKLGKELKDVHREMKDVMQGLSDSHDVFTNEFPNAKQQPEEQPEQPPTEPQSPPETPQEPEQEKPVEKPTEPPKEEPKQEPPAPAPAVK
jgi:hypothetical protein